MPALAREQAVPGDQATACQHGEKTGRSSQEPAQAGLTHRIVQVGTTIHIEKTSFKAWQKQYGRSIGLRAPGLFIAHLTRVVAKTGGTLLEVSAFQTKLSQYCHHCGRYRKKPRSERWHTCECGCGPVQRDLYAAFAAFLPGTGPDNPLYHPAHLGRCWGGGEPRLRAVMEDLQQRANAGQHLPQSMGLLASRKAARAGARRLKSPAYLHQEPCFSGEEQGNGG